MSLSKPRGEWYMVDQKYDSRIDVSYGRHRFRNFFFFFRFRPKILGIDYCLDGTQHNYVAQSLLAHVGLYPYRNGREIDTNRVLKSSRRWIFAASYQGDGVSCDVSEMS